MFQLNQNAESFVEAILNTKPKNKLFCHKTLGGLLNQSFLPNSLVKFVRKLNLLPKL